MSKLKVCSGCGIEFKAKSNSRIFCSHACANRRNAVYLHTPKVKKLAAVGRQCRGPRELSACEYCGKPTLSKYCSQRCVGLSQRLSPVLRKSKNQFFSQRLAARNRGIGWELTFRQWWRIWKESGHWEQRGRNNGQYVMARYGDRGPYSVDNVKIVTVDINLAERVSLKGEEQANAKLTEHDIREIRRLEGKVPRWMIAGQYGLNYYHVRDIQKRRCWKHVE
jgi:hypothetical protein